MTIGRLVVSFRKELVAMTTFTIFVVIPGQFAGERL